ncbi:hypothetical protein TCAL_13089 [Tigriopus californicus]|uniref:LisH domain-containing protein n=1 Tax=Tigriopus californicus TaxID=6832 RepID=A0A553PNB1_TIGCA|nr:hypothetical protein TCAL_13089 [Tigriopus californicus]
MVARMTSSPASRVQSASTTFSTNMIQWDKILGNCSRIYPELFPPQTPGKSLRRIPKVNEELLLNPKWQTGGKYPLSPPTEGPKISHVKEIQPLSSVETSFVIKEVILKDRLNFTKIKSDLVKNVANRDALTLWQALRWLITQSANGERTSVLQSYLNCDLMDLKAKEGQSSVKETILANLGRHDDDYGNEIPPNLILYSCISRMLNAIASLKSGRDYLGHCDIFVEKVIECLVKSGLRHSSDAILMLIATLQKLSLKCFIRKKMIDLGIVEWLVRFLEHGQDLSLYGLEYSTALFMNLCLHKSGKEKCLPIVSNVLEVLRTLLALNLKQIFPYLNGTLFSLLSHRQIALKAVEMDLQQHIEKIHSQVDEDAKPQLEHILDQLCQTTGSSPTSQESGSSFDESTSTISEVDDDESMDEDIEIEDEIDANDPLIHHEDDDFGMEFLVKNFIVSEKILIFDTDLETACPTAEKPPVVVKEMESPIRSKSTTGSSISPTESNETVKCALQVQEPLVEHSVSSDDGVVMVTDPVKPSNLRENKGRSDIPQILKDAGSNSNNEAKAKPRHQSLQRRRGSHSLTKENTNPHSEAIERSKSQPLNPAIPLPPVPIHASKESAPEVAVPGAKERSKSGVKKRPLKPREAESMLTSKSMTVLPPLPNNFVGKDYGMFAVGVDSLEGLKTCLSSDKETNGQPDPEPNPAATRLKSSSGEKRTISMTFPYSPLSNTTDDYNAVFSAKPRVSRSPTRQNVSR